ncbi:unnamed protein product [Caenorhabditis nigoni]
MDYQSFMDYQMHQVWLANQSVSRIPHLQRRTCTRANSNMIMETSHWLLMVGILEFADLQFALLFRKGGDLVCPYGSKCKFIHPEDGDLYQRFITDTEEFHQLKEGISEEVQKLHRLKKVSTDSKLIQALDNQINTMIRQWNQFCPKAPNYYDLHGMTSRGAVEYVLDIVQLMRVNGVRTSWLETGKGKHSLDNIPAIKTILLRDYHGVNGCYFVPLSSNDGVLELTVI